MKQLEEPIFFSRQYPSDINCNNVTLEVVHVIIGSAVVDHNGGTILRVIEEVHIDSVRGVRHVHHVLAVQLVHQHGTKIINHQFR